MNAPPPRRLRRFLPALAVLGLFLACVGSMWRAEGGFTALIRFGDYFADRATPAVRALPVAWQEESHGYDAQFYAQMAFDPLLLDPATATAMDNASYRFRRALMSWLAWLGGLGQPALIVQVFALLNVLAWLACAWLLTRWARPDTPDGFFRWSACLLGLGAITSVTHAMPDLVAMAFILGALRWWEARRPGASAGWLALALLAKETALLAGVLRWEGLGGGWRAWRGRLLYGFGACLPLGLWMGYLATLADPLEAGSPHNFAWPLVGLWGEVREVHERAALGHHFNLVALLSLGVQAAGLLVHRQWASPLWRVGAVHLVLALVLGRSVWEGDPGAAYRVLVPLTFAFNLTLPPDARGKWLWLVGGNLSALIGLDYLLRYW
jgi:hypothetical protein